ncbi:hypothetical protein AB6A40_011693 [Gnathostoma spinigerum]|uniref:Uncharacterized protein n=1 Tax=Gnathostoma spinigerum TaxID=75299 RepID=A0ABD6F289_9BILA
MKMELPYANSNGRRSSSIHEVSADFLRLNGSRQQFKNLLSARKRLDAMPPAYTRIDMSRESIESSGNAFSPSLFESTML